MLGSVAAMMSQSVLLASTELSSPRSLKESMLKALALRCHMDFKHGNR